MKPVHTVAAVTGALLALLGLALLAASAGTLWLHLQRDADGYLASPTFDLTTDQAGVVTDDPLELTVDRDTDRLPFLDRLTVRLEVTATDGEVFLGIAPAAELEAALADVGHDVLVRLGPDARTELRTVPGEVPLGPPAEQLDWTASAEGEAPLTLTWDVTSGAWGVLLADADGTPGVDAELRAAVRTSDLAPLGLGLLLFGLVSLVGGASLLVAGLSAGRPVGPAAPVDGPPIDGPPVDGPPAGVPPAAGAPGPYPLTLRASLDPDLSRWRWLVKWFLAIPHVLVLLPLWFAFVVLTVVAGLAILVTGRYPRAIFDLNVGVLRWTWRVSTYAFGPLSTDRYPPFTLDRSDHPAELEVVYPERLSRGLVLVKWLLALPHLLIVAVLTGGALSWVSSTGAGADETWRLSLGGGLAGVLVVVAAIALLATARYPRPIFDLVVGFHRWTYRVVAYVALMTDQYPPFRLDQGGEEPPVGTPPATPPSAPTTPREPAAV